MNFLTSNHVDEPTASSACFFMWHQRLRHLKPIYQQQPLPYELLPQPDSTWPDQLSPAIAYELETLLATDHTVTTTIRFTDAAWKITVAPTDNEHCIIFAEPLHSHQNPQGLAVLELHQAVEKLSGVEKNLRILELLQYYSRCDRIIIWQLEGQQLMPLYLNHDEAKPDPQTLDKRYLRAIESRKQLSFSDLFHQPMLAGQSYFKTAGVLARLDQAILLEGKTFGLLMLEYRQIQDTFSEETRAIAQSAASLLMMQHLPQPTTTVSPWILTDEGSDI